MSLNNTQTHGKLQMCQTLRGDIQITTETTQTYDLQKFATARSCGSTLFEIPPITQDEVPFMNTSKATKKVEGPNRERQMYKCHEP